MANWQIILVLVGLLIAGFVRQRFVLTNIIERLDLVDEFLNRFIEWCNGEAKDQAHYNWMVEKSNIVQDMLGRSGLIDFRPPFANYMHPNYAVILNEIPEIQKEFFDDLRTFNSIAKRNLLAHIRMVDSCLRRFIGSTEEQLKRERARLRNPLVLFCAGAACLMELLLYLLSECKIISTRRRAVIVNGKIFSVLSGLFTLATLIAAIITIVIGWDAFWKALADWCN